MRPMETKQFLQDTEAIQTCHVTVTPVFEMLVKTTLEVAPQMLHVELNICNFMFQYVLKRTRMSESRGSLIHCHVLEDALDAKLQFDSDPNRSPVLRDSN